MALLSVFCLMGGGGGTLPLGDGGYDMLISEKKKGILAS